MENTISSEMNLKDLYDLAVRAFSGTSHSPEVRASQYIEMYEGILKEDLGRIPEEGHQRYYETFKEWVRTIFRKHSAIVSVLTVGPARFPAARNEKANRAYDKAINDFEDWRVKARKAIARSIENAKSQEQKDNEEWARLRSEIASSITTCVAIDNGARGYCRPLFTNSIAGKIERLAKNGKTELVRRALDYIRDAQENNMGGLKKPLFTSRHKIWQLQQICEDAVRKQEELAATEEGELSLMHIGRCRRPRATGFLFEGGKIVKNYSEDRLQIIFDEKPAPEMISKLKHNGFRWSPRFGAWQRQLTSNALYACASILPITLNELKG